MQSLKERLFAHVTEALDVAKEPTLQAVKTGRWRRALDAMLSLLPGRSLAQESSAHFQEVLAQVHYEINDLIKTEVIRLWCDPPFSQLASGFSSVV